MGDRWRREGCGEDEEEVESWEEDASGEDLSSLVGCGWWGCDDP